MQQLGTIARLQVQRSGLKVPAAPGAAHGRVYSPEPLLEVQTLLLTPDGVIGLRDDQRVVDVHHRAHAETRNADVNGVSVGFTAHYEQMRGRFGDHIQTGIAGENVLVQSSARVATDKLQAGIAVRTQAGDLVRLQNVIVAEPCVEFTRFALRLGPEDRSGEAVTEGLRFLREGMRGFYATFAGTAAELRVGDAVFALD